MAETKDEPIVDITQTVSKAEKFIEDNKKSLAIIFGSAVVLLAAYFGWKKLYIEPLETEAQGKIFWAQNYFEKDSINWAIKGDGVNPGLEEIVDQYGSTPTGNLAHYYLGVCYLEKGKYEDAIEQLEAYDAKDEYTGVIATADIGECKMEMGKPDEAIKYYLKAADMNKNDFTSPIYLMKAANAYESMNNFADAAKVYEQIKSDFPDSREGKEVDKYLAYAKSKAGIQ
ncbi:MAG TPA: tetratricopeptide repeat protein [Bacteroidia bacterium]|jgi:tetratricopeptide (TPR) repeat protein